MENVEEKIVDEIESTDNELHTDAETNSVTEDKNTDSETNAAELDTGEAETDTSESEAAEDIPKEEQPAPKEEQHEENPQNDEQKITDEESEPDAAQENESETTETETNETEAADKGNEAAEEKIEETDETAEAVIAPAEAELVKEKKSNKKKGLIIGLIVLLLAGCIGYFAYDQSKRNAAHQEALDKIELTVAKNTLEYADSDPVETVTLVKTNGDVTADVAKIDVRKVGKTTVVYTVETADTYGKIASKTFEEKIEVIDTKAPVIELSDEEVSFYEGDDFTAKDHIASVKDPVDGDLELFEGDGETPKDKGWYTITSDVASDTAGTYIVKIHAEDKNGNKTDKEFVVTVNERPAEPEPNNADGYEGGSYSDYGYYDTSSGYSDPGYSGGYNDYSGYSSGGYSDSGSSSYYEEPAAPQPVVDYSIPPGTFASYEEACAYGESQWNAVHEIRGYSVNNGYTAAGVEYWIVTFNYRG